MGDTFYMLFPLCSGGELYEAVIKRGHFTEFDAACLIRDLISAISELHKRDILHLDIKPENILFESEAADARIKLTDFGLAKNYNLNTKKSSLSSFKDRIAVEELTKALKLFLDVGELQYENVRGTVGYMSPELILANVCSKAADVWAAGVVLFILLSGMPPFHSRSNR